MNMAVLDIIIIICTSFIAFAYKKNVISDMLSTVISHEYVDAFLTATLFVIVFRAIIYLYDNCLFKFFHKDRWIGGDWVYFLRNEDESIELYGVFNVKQGISGVSITNGKVWYCCDSPTEATSRGVWDSVIADISNNDFNFVFSHRTLNKIKDGVRGVIKDNDNILGFAELKISRTKSSVDMSGPYYDLREMAGSKGVIWAKHVNTKNDEDKLKLALEYANAMKE
ncbi:hypothetical protein GTA51_13635 [Desulfovibrio aerotolerans]|uniref:Uncharacterized protein n=1 Tax=Solidesulfovibrio aerotolerans TaxID=295255 RepID=A0A7C9MKA8_9BACT|nr:hypothetical protein [Solidesulfovibrio aerotolerans]MYL84169.1 hypothetical protein [Solidesulfovibrio aerotolerans]